MIQFYDHQWLGVSYGLRVLGSNFPMIQFYDHQWLGVSYGLRV